MERQACFPAERMCPFPSGLRNYEVWLWNYETSFGTPRWNLLTYVNYIQLIFIDLHCHHSDLNHLCPSCGNCFQSILHIGTRGRQRGPEMVNSPNSGDGGRGREKSSGINMCGEDRPLSAMVWAESLGSRNDTWETHQALTYFPAA